MMITRLFLENIDSSHLVIYFKYGKLVYIVMGKSIWCILWIHEMCPNGCVCSCHDTKLTGR